MSTKSKKENTDSDEKTSGTDKLYEIITNGFLLIVACGICAVFLYIYLNLKDTTSRLIFMPFLGFGLCIGGMVLSQVFKSEEMGNIFLKEMLIIFLAFWFGILTYGTIQSIKQGGELTALLFTIPFWIAGIFALIKFVIKKK